jgi:hypothetical protein
LRFTFGFRGASVKFSFFLDHSRLEAFCGKEKEMRMSALGKNDLGYALRWTIPGPDSSYSCLEHQRFWKVESEARMEPPI